MNRFLCFLHIHIYGDWYHVTEVPIWKRGGGFSDSESRTCLGNQPVKEQLYMDGKGGTVKHIEPDLHFRLIGKLVEQKRKCIHCSYLKVNYQRLKI